MGMESVWNESGDGNWFKYIQESMDFYVQNDGTIKGYRPDEYNIDHINNGKLVLLLYQVTGKEKYKKAADLLRNQLRTHPRTSEGGFWHKKIYTNQMWLDGLYMGAPFYAEYAMLFHEDSAFDDVATFQAYFGAGREAFVALGRHFFKVLPLNPHFFADGEVALRRGICYRNSSCLRARGLSPGIMRFTASSSTRSGNFEARIFSGVVVLMPPG